MSSNKCVLFTIFLMMYVFLSASSAIISKVRTSHNNLKTRNLLQYPNPKLGFPDRARSVANAVYSAIELSLVTFPFEKIEDEVAEMKYVRILLRLL